MDKKNTHQLLLRQLQRLELKLDERPSLEKWHTLLERVSTAYSDADQERYLLERSLEISSREILELTGEQVRSLNQQLLETARLAGMSEVATSVLHNIGNALNSANISLMLMKEQIKGQTKDSYFEKIKFVAHILKENIEKKTNYLSDHKIELIPKFLIEISNILVKCNEEFDNEMKNMEIHLEHIKNIVIAQREMTVIAGIREKVYLHEAIDLAIQLSFGMLHLPNLEIEKNYQFSGYSILDRSKLLQILVNILRNAKEALSSKSDDEYKKINITSRKDEKRSTFEIIIEDNGIGIAKENFTQIFSFGFTTKRNAHGFGLHSSAIAAKELGGQISVASEGIGLGSRFTIELPYTVKVTEEHKELPHENHL